MSRIINPTALELKIIYNEITGRTDFTTSRDAPVPLVILIFSNLISQLIKEQIQKGFMTPATREDGQPREDQPASKKDGN